MTAYYNEIDPFAADWLRNLIAAGHIAPGDVDERDIRDVRPDELVGYTQCHFFAGIGVWSYALRCAGWPDDRPVWTGSCPCQPFSEAGRGGGFADERHLWPHWFHLISQCLPETCFGEQVASKDGLGWLDLVHADLEGAGYAVGAADTCAAGVGAPHIRQRLYWVADAMQPGRAERRAGAGLRQTSGCCSVDRLADPDGEQHDRCRDFGARRRIEFTNGGDPDGMADASGAGLSSCQYEDLCGTGRRSEGRAAEQRRGASSGLGDTNQHGCNTREPGDGRGQAGAGCQPRHGAAGPSSLGGLADTDGRQRDGIASGEGGERDRTPTGRIESDGQPECRGEIGGLADAAGPRHDEAREYERGQPQLPARSAEHGGLVRPAGPTNGIWRDADWLLCRDDKWRPVEPGTFPLAHGAPARVGRLRGYGNAINAAQAEAFIRARLDLDAFA